nr:ribonuclease H-like domain-containing protein [Tanacetum cinerariifolium]
VLVTKPHNTTPYELLHGRLPSIGFMRPFGCHVTILNTLDPLGKFQGKETLHVNFMENKPNVAGSGPAWLFDIDSLLQTMNYHPVLAENQSNTHAGFQDTKKAEEEGTQTYVLFPVLSDGSTNPKNNNKDAHTDGNKHDDDIQEFVSPDIHSLSYGDQTRKQGDKAENKDKGKSLVFTITRFMDLNEEFKECINNSSNGVNAVGSLVSATGLNFTNSTNDSSAAGPSNAAMQNLEDLSHNANDVGAEADINNMESIISVNEGFLVGYSVCSKAFKVFNSRTRIVQETLHVNFIKNKPNVAGSGPAWLFDIDSLSQTMNYHPVFAENQSHSNAGFQDTKKAKEEGTQSYVLFPILSDGSTNPKNNNKDILVDGKEHDDDIQKSVSPDIHSLSCGDQTREQGDKAENKDKGKSPIVTITGFRDLNKEFAECINNSSNGVNTAGFTVSATELNFTNSINDFSVASPSNAAMPNLEDLSHNADDVGTEADINNMESISLGFYKLVEESWKEAPVDDTNALIKMMKKLKYLKEKTRVWNKLNKESPNNSKTKLKAELA